MEPFLTQNVFLFSTTLAPHFFHILAQIKTEMMAVEFPLEWWCFFDECPYCSWCMNAKRQKAASSTASSPHPRHNFATNLSLIRAWYFIAFTSQTSHTLLLLQSFFWLQHFFRHWFFFTHSAQAQRRRQLEILFHSKIRVLQVFKNELSVSV